MAIEWFRPARPALLAFAYATALAGSATAQGVIVIPRQNAPPTPAARAAPAMPPIPARTSIRIPEGTEVGVRLKDQLSSATAAAGDTFTISTDEEIRLADGVVIPAGYRGKGEVTEAHKKEMLGKAGELSVRLDYVRIGDVRVHLRANKSGEGKSSVTTTVVLTVLLTPLFLMHHGHEIVFPKGQPIVGYVDEDTDISLPVPPAPRED